MYSSKLFHICQPWQFLGTIIRAIMINVKVAVLFHLLVVVN